MKPGWIFKDSQVIELPSLTAVIEKEGGWFVSKCPELGVASQGKTRKEAYAMLAEAVEAWLDAASAKEIGRRLKVGASVQPLELAHAQAAAIVRHGGHAAVAPARIPVHAPDRESPHLPPFAARR